MVARIPVEKPADTSADDENLNEQIRQLAFHLFESRGRSDGYAIEDWLEAERELVLMPESIVVQRNGKFEISMPAEGYKAGEIHVTVSPAHLTVRAASNGNAGHKTLLGTVDLPEPIDIDRTSATLDKGILHIIATKSTPEQQPAGI